MYESIFEFQQRPFLATPIVERYFPSSSCENARQNLTRAVERAEGPGMLVGSAGMGKTMLCQVLAAQFREEFQVVMLASARLRSARALLQYILFELGLPYREREEGELRLALMDHLQRSAECPNGILLIVDEAHTLPLKLLEEIRMITNVVRGDEPRVRLIVAGGPTLEERFASPKLESLNQRIAARCYLESMNREETAQYVSRQITTVGEAPNKIFSDDAFSAIHIATGGVPRLVNQVCDHALILAAAGGKSHLDAMGIEEAWADLQQLPAPSLSNGAGAGENVIEFGQLDDEHGISVEVNDFDKQPDDSADPMPEAVDPTRQLAQIEQQINNANQDFAQTTEFDPGIDDQFIASSPPAEQLELILENARNPFEEVFEDEEIVEDKYAMLDRDSESQMSHTTGVNPSQIPDSIQPAAEQDSIRPETEAEEASREEEIVEDKYAMLDRDSAAELSHTTKVLPPQIPDSIQPAAEQDSIRTEMDAEEAFEEEEIVEDKYAMLDRDSTSKLSDTDVFNPQQIPDSIQPAAEQDSIRPETAAEEASKDENMEDKYAMLDRDSTSKLPDTDVFNPQQIPDSIQPAAEQDSIRPETEAEEVAGTSESVSETVSPAVNERDDDVDQQLVIRSETLEWTPDLALASAAAVDHTVSDVSDQVAALLRDADEAVKYHAEAQEVPDTLDKNQPPDDRDIIIVDEHEETSPLRGPQKKRGHRQEYKRLFASLRQG